MRKLASHFSPFRYKKTVLIFSFCFVRRASNLISHGRCVPGKRTREQERKARAGCCNGRPHPVVAFSVGRNRRADKNVRFFFSFSLLRETSFGLGEQDSRVLAYAKRGNSIGCATVAATTTTSCRLFSDLLSSVSCSALSSNIETFNCDNACEYFIKKTALLGRKTTRFVPCSSQLNKKNEVLLKSRVGFQVPRFFHIFFF